MRTYLFFFSKSNFILKKRQYDVTAKDIMDQGIQNNVITKTFTYYNAIELLSYSELQIFPVVDNLSKFFNSYLLTKFLFEI